MRHRQKSARFVRYTLALVCIGAFFTVGIALRAEAPATQPSAQIAPEAASLLAQVRDAYVGLKSLTVNEKVDARFDVDGVQQTHTANVKGIFTSGGLFRDELTDNTPAQTQPSERTAALIGNTGIKFFVFLPADNRYVQHDTPKEKFSLDLLGADIASVLRSQDPSIALALSADPAATIAEGANRVSLGEPTKIDSISYPTLRVSGDTFDTLILIDPETHLIRREQVDLTKELKQRGAAIIKQAAITDDFASVPNGEIPLEAFAWAPPPGSQELSAPDTGDADLAGQPAPSFTLTSLDGRTVDSKSLKGTVYVLDFWATWCGPCCASLPHMDQMYKDLKSSGVKFFAVNEEQPREDLEKFVADTHLTIPVLLDSDGKTGSLYDKQSAIPFTVVVGKDGIIVKSGFFGGAEEQIRPLIEAANATR